MTSRTLLGWSLALSLLAGCSGGSGGTASTGLSNGTQAQFTIDTSKLASALARTPKYVGASINAVDYAFAGGTAPSGSLSLPSAACPANGNPPTYLCTISLPPFNYTNLTLTLKVCTTPPSTSCTNVGTGAAGANVNITSGNTTAVTITIAPTIPNAASPVLAVTGGQATQFYKDGNAQTINLTANNLDPKGNVVDQFYGTVSNWLPLTFSLTGGSTGAGAPATIAAVPTNGGLGTTNAHVTYDGVGANATSLTVQVSDATHTASVVIPYISLSNSGTPVNIQSIGANGCAGACTVTVTEAASTGGTATLDPKFSSSSTCGTHATFTPTLGVGGSGNATTAGAVTYTIVANDIYSGVGTCTLTVTSQQDPLLSTAIVINFPGQAGATIN
jgi:hypothetical protein